ncbi:MAG: peptidylprolyl isomerase [Candidatus Aminicenantes bacterium]|nr:peptidylprolyl isomerase [Candidatus Aminicenantes bacterium]
MRIFTVIIALLLLLSCTGNKEKNIFSDETVRKIYTLQDQRDSKGLFLYFNNKNPLYRKYAALSFASIQDKEAVDELTLLLSDEDQGVRMAAAYALGQTADIKAEPGLLKSFKTEKSDNVRMTILESLGKCGGDESLEFLSDPSLKRGNDLIMKGQALGIYRFILRKKHAENGLETVIRTLLKSDSPDVRFYASNALSRIRNVDLSNYFEDLRDLIGREKEDRVKMNLIIALGKCKGGEVVKVLRAFLSDGIDQRIVVNSIRALGKFEYDIVKSDILKFVTNKSYQISVAASEVLMRIGSAKDYKAYFDISRKTLNWRAGANLLKISLKLAPDKPEISSMIKSYYKKSVDPYEKGSLLIALSEDLMNYPFIEEETFKKVEKVISTSGMLSISEMISKKGYDPEKEISTGKGSHVLRKIFADIFKRGILSGDSSLISISSSALRDPGHKFREVVSDLTFLEKSLEQVQKPGDEDKKRDIERTLNFFRGIKEDKANNSIREKSLDWERIANIPADQRVRIETDEGAIIIKLYVDDAPGSVSNFLDLIREGYLGRSAFHRVVPNFVIQDGCPRGDGWGGPEETIRSEFSRAYYEEGSVGMASSGKDTEGSQWFITHSSTPHLDGRYTIFGKVIEGMEIVNRIKVGTRIFKYVIL